MNFGQSPTIRPPTLQRCMEELHELRQHNSNFTLQGDQHRPQSQSGLKSALTSLLGALLLETTWGLLLILGSLNR